MLFTIRSTGSMRVNFPDCRSQLSRPVCSSTHGNSNNRSSDCHRRASWSSPPCLARQRRSDAVIASAMAKATASAVSPVHVEAVVIVDHGSRRAESNAMLHQFAELYKEASGRTLVEVAHMEIAPPSIADAVAKCVAGGATSVIIAPYFLSRGRHIQDDIPALVAEAALLYPGVRCTVAAPIGLDPLMAQLIEKRVEAAAEALVMPPL